MNLFCSSFPKDTNYLFAGSPPDNRVIYQNYSFSLKGISNGVKLDFDLHIAGELGRLDESSANIVISGEPHSPGNSALPGITQGSHHSRVRNTNGQHSVWDTIPNNGCSLLGVAKADRPDILINRPDGSVGIDIQNPCTLILYLADNGSISGGRTKYEVIITFTDGRVARAPVGGMT